MNNRPTRNKRSTRATSEPEKPAPKTGSTKRKRRLSEAATSSPPATKRRRRRVEAEEAAEPPKKPGRRTRAKTKKSSTIDNDRVIVLAMSPYAANILRTMIGKARYEEPELDAMKKELEDQLDGSE